MTVTHEVGQKTDPRVTQALERAVELGEVGVQVAAYLGDELIVDAWIGEADPESGRVVDGDTLFQAFSMIKAFTVTALHIQVQRGLVEYDAPIARYWPEFGKHGKDKILVRHVLEHRSGVPNLPAGTHPIDPGYRDWDAITAGIADLQPLSPPGELGQYQSHSMGWMLGMVIQGSDPEGRTIKQFIQDEVMEPLKIKDVYIGLPPEEDHRNASLVGGPLIVAPGAPPREIPQPPAFHGEGYRRAYNVAGSAVMTARAQVRLWALLANRGELDGVRLLEEGRVWSFTRPRPNPTELDSILGYTPYMGAYGYWLGGPYPPAEPGVGEGSYILCQTGAGQSIGWADLETRLSVAICHNRMFQNTPLLPADKHPWTHVGDAIREVAAERAASR